MSSILSAILGVTLIVGAQLFFMSGAMGRCHNETATDVNPTPAQHLKSLVNIMHAEYILLREDLSMNAGDNVNDFYKLLKQMAALGEQEQRLRALLTLKDTRNDFELTALRTILGKLVENACGYIEAKTSIKNCSYTELLKLKLKLDLYETIMDSLTPAKIMLKNLNVTGGAFYYRYWYNDVISCILSEDELASLNLAFGTSLNLNLNKRCCSAN